MASTKSNVGVYTVNLQEIDPGIKLFGRKIEMQTADLSNEQMVDQTQNTASEASSQLDDLGSSSGSCEEETILKSIDNPESESLKKVSSKTDVLPPTEVTPPTQNEQQQQEKRVLKRPDKLVPCPRCNSMDTKFCYFNNYNVNQPRHFCKNCQRYWTAGGTLRNVPVGAGRRKSKHVTSTTNSNNSMSDHSQVRSTEHPRTRPSVLPPEFCHFVPPPEASPSSVASSMLTSLSSGCPAVSSSSGSKRSPPPMEEKEAEGTRECTGCFNGMNPSQTWPCFGWNNFPAAAAVAAAAASLHQNSSEKSNNPTATPHLPGMENLAAWMNTLWSNPFLWGASAPGWNVPWAAAVSTAFASQYQKNLGKHPREKIEEGCGRVEGCLWAPKTLRIDDPGEAAKSSIWATLGLDRSPVAATVSNLGTTNLKKDGDTDDKGVKCVNPAARSRSMSFQENN